MTCNRIFSTIHCFLCGILVFKLGDIVVLYLNICLYQLLIWYSGSPFIMSLPPNVPPPLPYHTRRTSSSYSHHDIDKNNCSLKVEQQSLTHSNTCTWIFWSKIIDVFCLFNTKLFNCTCICNYHTYMYTTYIVHSQVS